MTDKDDIIAELRRVNAELLQRIAELERMWTAIATCDKQGRSFFHFLQASIDAKINGRSAPRLLNT